MPARSTARGTTRSRRFSTRQRTHFSTGRSRSFSSTMWPAWAVRRTSCLPLPAADMDVNSNLPFVMLTRDFADKLLAAAGEPSLARAREKIDRDLKPRSRELKGWTLTERS